jgi:hypothetical protein
MSRTKISAAELIQAAIANAEQAAQVLRHAAMESLDPEHAADLWKRATRLEKVIAPLQRTGEGNLRRCRKPQGTPASGCAESDRERN